MCWSPARSCATTAPRRWPAIRRSKPPTSAAPRLPSNRSVMDLDLILRNARIAGREHETVDIGIAGGRIVAVAPNIASEAPGEQLDGRLVVPGLVESHIHLDKSNILDRCRCEQGTLHEAIIEVAAAKRAFTEEDVYSRAQRTLEKAIAQGTMHMRTHVEVDPRVG